VSARPCGTAYAVVLRRMRRVVVVLATGQIEEVVSARARGRCRRDDDPVRALDSERSIHQFYGQPDTPDRRVGRAEPEQRRDATRRGCLSRLC
jgi:hypothetical protein